MVLHFPPRTPDYPLTQLCHETVRLSPEIAKRWFSLLVSNHVITLSTYANLFAMAERGKYE